RLRARVIGCAWWDRTRGGEQIAGFLARRREAPDGRYRATSVKIMQDGVCENHTAALLAPYLDGSGAPTGNRGLSFIDPEDLKGHVAALDGQGFQVHFHALGDRAVRECLDAVAHAATRNGRNDHRHHLAHIQIVDPADIPRFAALGAVANAQPLWANHDGYQDELTIPFLGTERSARQYPFRSLLDAGAVLALGSDWAVSTPDPWQIMHVAVTRTLPGGSDRVFYPEQRITPLEALRGYTMGSAFVNHIDDVTGSITPGKLADVVVTDRDPVRDGFDGTEVALTMIGGEVVFAR
ncbi:MAG: amidohydrolase, partial [Actinobacteria bacterium]